MPAHVAGSCIDKQAGTDACPYESLIVYSNPTKGKNLPPFLERGFLQTRKSQLRGNQYNPHIGQDPTHVGFAGLPGQTLKPAPEPAGVRNVHAGMVYCADVGQLFRNPRTFMYLAWPSAYASVNPSECGAVFFCGTPVGIR